MNKGANFLGLKLSAKNQWLQRVQEFIDQAPRKFPYALRVTLSGGAPEAHPSFPAPAPQTINTLYTHSICLRHTTPRLALSSQ